MKVVSLWRWSSRYQTWNCIKGEEIGRYRDFQGCEPDSGEPFLVVFENGTFQQI